MELTAYEKTVLQIILTRNLKEAENFVVENPNTIEAYLCENETIPFLKRIIAKLD